MLISSIISKTDPTEFSRAFLTLHVRTTTIFINDDSTIRAWFSFDNIDKMIKVFSLMFICYSDDVWKLISNCQLRFVFPLSRTFFTLVIGRTSLFFNKSCIITFRIRTFSNLLFMFKIQRKQSFLNLNLFNSVWQL